MKRFKEVIAVAMCVLLSINIIACGSQDKKNSSSVGGLSNTKSSSKVSDKELPIEVKGENYPLTVKDYLKDETVIKTKPEKVAVLSGTPLNIWYDLGGKSVCTSDVSENIKLVEEHRDEIKNLPKIGPVYSIDMEGVIKMKPDLIIAQVGTQSKEAKKLREMGFNVVSTHIRGYNDVLATYRAFGKILGVEDKAEERIKKLEESKNQMVSKLPKEKKSAVILYVTSKSLAVKLDNSIAGDVARILNIDNISSGLAPDTIGSESAPIDIEYIVGKNPDYVIVTSMISSNKKAKETMEEQFKNNPAWKGVKAISDGRVIYLPQEYFLYNAGPYYDEAIEYMARGIYPDVYGKLEEWYGK